MLFARTAVLPLLLMTGCMTGCVPLQSIMPRGTPADDALARSVTIVRDEWGVPSVYGPTDAAVAFGVAYAQAEDNYWQIEEDYIHALGRASHYYGEEYLAADLVKAAFEVERYAREEYAREPADRRAVWDAFAAGLNYYMRTAPGVQPRLITRWEPWMPFARFRTMGAGTTVDGVRLGQISSFAQNVTGTSSVGDPDAAGRGGVALVGVWDEGAANGPGTEGPLPRGSNMWAVSGDRTASGHALIFQNPHVGYFGAGQRYEMHIQSDVGWHVRGFAILGTPIPRAGHNEHFAWSHTNSGADHSDVYEVVFDHPDDPLQYRYDGGWRRAGEWEHTVRVNTAQGVVDRVYRFRRTHHGPVVALRAGRALAVRAGRNEDGGSMQQWYAMGKAADLDEFRTTLDRRALTISNTMYADRAGNIYYLHGNAVPRRDPSFDWSRPVDGSTTATEWQGYHELHELPQLLNPAAGWLQNTNATPFLATAEGSNLDPSVYPAYMAPEPDNARARRSRQLLAGEEVWTFDTWAQAAFDSYVLEAEDAFGQLVLEWEQVGGTNPERAMRLDEAIDELRSWDRISSIESEAMTLFVLWQDRLRMGAGDGELAQFRALEDVTAELRRHFSRSLVPWGEVNRLQRTHTSGQEPFREDQPSLPVRGAPGWTGIIFNVTSAPGPAGRRYGRSGHTWVSVAELGPTVQSRSIVQFGQSADPASPHFFDQAPLFVVGEMKPAWFVRDDVMAAARRVYQPAGP